MRKKDPNKKTLVQEFKEFISRGNILDMAVGVVIGSAFGAIVTALVNILLSLCLWAVPGGLKGLVTVLPALNNAQKGMDSALVIEDGVSLGQKFEASYLQLLSIAEAEKLYSVETVAENPNLVESVKSTILSKYTLHGTTYTYNLSTVIDWGTFINAIISFLIIAFVLFVIVKVANKASKIRIDIKTKTIDKIKKLNNDTNVETEDVKEEVAA